MAKLLDLKPKYHPEMRTGEEPEPVKGRNLSAPEKAVYDAFFGAMDATMDEPLTGRMVAIVNDLTGIMEEVSGWMQTGALHDHEAACAGAKTLIWWAALDRELPKL